MLKTTKYEPRRVYWQGTQVADCDLCNQPITKRMIDGKTTSGPWGLMCVPCHKTHGTGLGTGRGQAYEHQTDGRWLKVEG